MAVGMTSFNLSRKHLEKDAGLVPALSALKQKSKGLDAERMARRMLETAMAGGGDTLTSAEYRGIGIDKVPFSKNRIVKFRQHFNKVPVYGSITSVEIDGTDDLVSITGTMGEPPNVSAVASVSPAQALGVVGEHSGEGEELAQKQPRLHYLFDRDSGAWRLVYIVEDVLRSAKRDAGHDHAHEHEGAPRDLSAEFFDYVVDAHSGELVAELARTPGLEQMGTAKGIDLAGKEYDFVVTMLAANGEKWMHDPERNIHTYDFGFKDVVSDRSTLPGDYVRTPPGDWSPAAVSAHVNTRRVADWLMEMLERDGIDGEGGPIISSVNCLRRGDDLHGKEWRNAQRLPRQMVYGQRMVGGELRSYAASLEIVAHELMHGVTDRTARLENYFQTGALNESYSDIFGVAIANHDEKNVGKWEWRIGDEMRDMGGSIRNMKDPKACNHPDHMDDYLDLGGDEDEGGVHKNNGIHNKAAYNIFTAKKGSKFLFKPEQVVQMFYVTLTSRLSRTSEFIDSRHGVLATADGMFADDKDRARKIAAIEKAFDDVGIKGA